MNYSPINLIKKIWFSLGSSRWLAQRLVHASNIKDVPHIHILELWAGYGNVTKEIIKNLSKDSTLTVIEFEESRIEKLREYESDNVHIIHGNVAKLSNYIENNSVLRVISTLPLWSFDKTFAIDILKNIAKVLKKERLYIQYQYWMANKKDIKNIFKLRKILFEPRNITPAFIYVTDNIWWGSLVSNP